MKTLRSFKIGSSFICFNGVSCECGTFVTGNDKGLIFSKHMNFINGKKIKIFYDSSRPIWITNQNVILDKNINLE